MSQTSKTTVSLPKFGKYKKMSRVTREKIESFIHNKLHKPSIFARSLNSKRTKLIGVDRWYYQQFLKLNFEGNFEDRPSQWLPGVMIGNSNYSRESEDRYIESMLLLGVDGFIIQHLTFPRIFSYHRWEKEENGLFW